MDDYRGKRGRPSGKRMMMFERYGLRPNTNTHTRAPEEVIDARFGEGNEATRDWTEQCQTPKTKEKENVEQKIGSNSKRTQEKGGGALL